MSRLVYNVVIFKIDLFKKQTISCQSNCHSVIHNVCFVLFVLRPALIVSDLVSHSIMEVFSQKICVVFTFSQGLPGTEVFA